MRNGESIADAGRAQALPLQHGFEDLACRKPGNLGSSFAELLERRLFRGHLQRWDDRLIGDQIVQRHTLTRICKSAGPARTSG